MEDPYIPPHRSWAKKFADAGIGIISAAKGQSSFAVHFVMTVVVIALAAILKMTTEEWCLLVLCIAVVLAAETFNSALEAMAKAVDKNFNEHLGTALNMASGAVLWVAIGSVIVGCVIFGRRFLELWLTYQA